MSNKSEIKSRTLTITKTFNAPLKRVWRVWTDDQHIKNWWGAPGMETKILKHDFKTNGHWKYAMIMGNGGVFTSEGVFIELIPLQKVRTTASFKPMTEGVEIEVMFEGHEQNTQFTFNCLHPTAAYCKQQEEMGFFKGWGAVFDRLDAYLQKED